MPETHWDKADDFLVRYSKKALSDRVGFHHRETPYVLLRGAVLFLCGWLLYAGLGSFVEVPLLALVVLTFVDAVLVVTAHAVVDKRPVANNLRFVVLNLLTFLTLTLWFAAAFQPFAAHFCDGLDYLNAIELAFAATTASATSSPHEAIDWIGSLVTGLATAVALYFIVVVLVMAVGRVQQGSSSNDE